MRATVSKLMKGVSYTLLAVGLLMLLGGRLSADVARLFDDTTAFATLAASCLLYGRTRCR